MQVAVTAEEDAGIAMNETQREIESLFKEADCIK
jgi:hypothetical protein